jgi:hypothetical protein
LLDRPVNLRPWRYSCPWILVLLLVYLPVCSPYILPCCSNLCGTRSIKRWMLWMTEICSETVKARICTAGSPFPQASSGPPLWYPIGTWCPFGSDLVSVPFCPDLVSVYAQPFWSRVTTWRILLDRPVNLRPWRYSRLWILVLLLVYLLVCSPYILPCCSNLTCVGLDQSNIGCCG